MELEPGRLPTSVRRYNQGTTSLTNTSNRLPVPRRASAMQSSTIQQRPVEEEEDQPTLLRQRPHRRWHPLTLLGSLLLLFLAGWWLLFQVTSWWQVTQDDWHYGRPRTFQTDAVVGHHDSPTQPSHFLVLNLHGHILIYELPGGDAARTQVYIGPVLLGPGQDLTPVRYPMARSQGLVSVLHGNSSIPCGMPAFASSYDTSRNRNLVEGYLTNSPSFPTMAEPLARKERYDRPRTFYPGSAFLPGTRSVQLERNHVGELSLSGEAECLSLHTSILFEGGKNGDGHSTYHAP